MSDDSETGAGRPGPSTSLRLVRLLERSVLLARWLMVPFYLGLLASLVLLLVKFFQALGAALFGALRESTSDALINVLKLVDISLAANLVVLVVFAGWENFVARMSSVDADDRPAWMGKLDFTGLKLKLTGSIVAISGIYLLETFMYLHEVPTTQVILQIVVHLTFVVSGLLMAWSDRLEHHGKS